MKNWSRTGTFAFALSLLLGLGSAGPANANLITNGGFETNTLAGWTSSGFVGTTPWTLCCGAFNSQPVANGTYLAVLGYSDAATNGWLSQTFSTTAGSTYFLSFDYGAFGSNAQQVTVTATNSTLGAIVVTDATPTFNRSLLVGSYNYSFSATGASSTLTFTDTSGVYVGALGALDNVSIKVPLPGTVALMALGLAGFGAARRRTA